MDLAESLVWFAVGGAIGFFTGYVVRALREIEQKVDHVEERVTHDQHDKRPRDERGAVRMTSMTWRSMAVLLVVLLTAYSAVSAQLSINEGKADERRDQAREVEDQRQSECTQKILGDLLVAVNERTKFSVEQAKANVALQRSQSKFVAILLIEPPATDEQRSAALETYFDNLTDFLTLSSKTADQAVENPYPTAQELSSCLGPMKEKQDE